jgi:hypothetical protein
MRPQAGARSLASSNFWETGTPSNCAITDFMRDGKEDCASGQ